MRIAESARTPLLQFAQKAAVSPDRKVSDVSREERLQLLTERKQSQKGGTAPDTYSERAQLLSVSASPQHSWVV